MCYLETTIWSADDYADALTPRNSGQNQRVEEKLARKLPPIHFPRRKLDRPAIVKDPNGNILLWYLPGLVSPRRQVISIFLDVQVEITYLYRRR